MTPLELAEYNRRHKKTGPMIPRHRKCINCTKVLKEDEGTSIPSETGDRRICDRCFIKYNKRGGQMSSYHWLY